MLPAETQHTLMQRQAAADPHIRIIVTEDLHPPDWTENWGKSAEEGKIRLRNIWMGRRVCCITVRQIMGTAGPRTITSSCKQKRIPIPYSIRCT